MPKTNHSLLATLSGIINTNSFSDEDLASIKHKISLSKNSNDDRRYAGDANHEPGVEQELEAHGEYRDSDTENGKSDIGDEVALEAGIYKIPDTIEAQQVSVEFVLSFFFVSS
jgi:hypothetical protein